MNTYVKVVALLMFCSVQVLIPVRGQDLQGKRLIGGDGSVKFTQTRESIQSKTQNPIETSRDLGIYLNGTYAYAPINNLFFGAKIDLSRNTSRFIKPNRDDFATIYTQASISVFGRLVAPFKVRFRPYMELGATYSLTNYTYDGEEDNLDYPSIYLRTAVSIFNKDYTRSIDIAPGAFVILKKDYYGEIIPGGVLYIGYSVYF